MSVDDVTVSAGSTATLTCTATLPQYSHYQANSTVIVQFLTPSASVVSSTATVTTDGRVTATYSIPSLSVSRTGVYTCGIGVSSITQFIINSLSRTDTATVKLNSKIIRCADHNYHNFLQSHHHQ